MKRRLRPGLFSVALLAAFLLPASGSGGAPVPPVATAPSATHVKNFDILRTPVRLSELPRFQRPIWERMLPSAKRGGLRKGTVHVDGGTITAVGNRHMICFTEWRRDIGGGGSCDSTAHIMERGLSVVRICGERGSDEVRISGIVPNGISGLGVDRKANGEIEETVPVKLNAFAVSLQPVGVVLHGIGDAGTAEVQLKYPLERLTRLCSN